MYQQERRACILLEILRQIPLPSDPNNWVPAEDGLAYYNSKWGLPKLEVQFWGPDNKDYDMLGSILGHPISGNYQIRAFIATVLWFL